MASYNALTVSFLIIIASVVASLRPPLLLIIKAHPLLLASNAIRPKGSSQREGTTQILTFKKIHYVFMFLKPKIYNFCLKFKFSLFSSPIITFSVCIFFNILCNAYQINHNLQMCLAFYKTVFSFFCKINFCSICRLVDN